MQRVVKWGNNRLTLCIGRNGDFNCSGVDISTRVRATTPPQTIVNINPLTSRGVLAKADLDVPIEDLPAVITALEEIMADHLAG